MEHAQTAVLSTGLELAYQDSGAGEPVVFVHGALSDLRCWSGQIAAVSDAFRTITYSRRYHYPNQPILRDSADPWDVHVEDLAEFLRAINADPAHLVGNSQGAFIILLLASRYPHLVRSLVLAEAPVLSLYLDNPPTVSQVARFLLTHPVTAIANLGFGARTIAPAQKAFRDGNDELAVRLFVQGALATQTFDDLDKERQSQILENLAPMRAFMLGEGFPALNESTVRAVRCPVLLVVGSMSPSFIVYLTDRLEELLPLVERVAIEGASHLSHEEKPAAFNSAILEFLKRNRGNASSDTRLEPGT